MPSKPSKTKPLIWPTVQLSEVFHLGRLDPELKGTTHNHISREGNGLSVSLHPQEWREIAKLGGEPLWILRQAAPAQFLDLYALKDRQRKAIESWAQEQGLLTPAQTIEVQWIDADTGEPDGRVYDASDPSQVEEAEEEYEFRLEEHDDAKMKRSQDWRATAALKQRVGFDASFDVPFGLAMDIAITFFVEDVLYKQDGFHGVWWDSDLDPANHSAPCGAIHKRAIGSWTAELVEEARPSRRMKAGGR